MKRKSHKLSNSQQITILTYFITCRSNHPEKNTKDSSFDSANFGYLFYKEMKKKKKKNAMCFTLKCLCVWREIVWLFFLTGDGKISFWNLLTVALETCLHTQLLNCKAAHMLCWPICSKTARSANPEFALSNIGLKCSVQIKAKHSELWLVKLPL